MALELRLNPNLDVEALAATFAERGFVQAHEFLDPEVAELLHRTMVERTPWRLVYTEADHSHVSLSQADLQRLGPQEVRRRLAEVMTRAAGNIGYCYSNYPMIKAYLSGWDPGHPLHAMTEFLNSPEFLGFARRLIGVPGLTKVSAQATFYAPGNFLTRHVDEGDVRERRAAYTLGFAKDWEPDWGGLLMFIDENKDVARAYTPRFNVLTVFDGLKIHSVSAVAPFARGGRYGITGWFQDDPPGPGAGAA